MLFGFTTKGTHCTKKVLLLAKLQVASKGKVFFPEHFDNFDRKPTFPTAIEGSLSESGGSHFFSVREWRRVVGADHQGCIWDHPVRRKMMESQTEANEVLREVLPRAPTQRRRTNVGRAKMLTRCFSTTDSSTDHGVKVTFSQMKDSTDSFLV